MNEIEKQGPVNEEAFVNKARTLLEQSEQNLDNETLAGLRQARLTALHKQSPLRVSWLLPAGGLVATATIAIVIGMNILTNDLSEHEIPDAFADIELITSSDNLEFFEQLEFYAWLEEQEKSG